MKKKICRAEPGMGYCPLSRRARHVAGARRAQQAHAVGALGARQGRWRPSQGAKAGARSARGTAGARGAAGERGAGGAWA